MIGAGGPGAVAVSQESAKKAGAGPAWVTLEDPPQRGRADEATGKTLVERELRLGGVGGREVEEGPKRCRDAETLAVNSS